MPTFTIPREGQALGDTGRYKHRFSVASDSNPNKRYTIAFDIVTDYWTCSCPGAIHRGECKHLKRYGLKGRGGKGVGKVSVERVEKAIDTILDQVLPPKRTDDELATIVEGFQ